MDDLIGDEADEVADQAEVQKAYRQVHQNQDQDINPEQLEQYIKDRFESRQEYAGGDFNEQAGTATPPHLASVTVQVFDRASKATALLHLPSFNERPDLFDHFPGQCSCQEQSTTGQGNVHWLVFCR